MASVLDIVRGISQAAANAYDGSQDEKYSLDGEARKIGLKREEGDPIIDSFLSFESDFSCLSVKRVFFVL